MIRKKTSTRLRSLRAITSPALAALVILALGPSVPFPVRADGVYLPSIASPALPTVPRQTALIVQHGTTQTWIIESPLDAEAQSIGWIIPLPAAPDTVEAARPGVLRSLEQIAAPAMIHDLWPTLKLVLLATALLLYLTLALSSPAVSFPRAITGCLMWAFVLIVPIGLFLPVAGGGSSSGVAASGSGLSEIRSLRAGSYEISILQGTHADALNTWLNQHQLRELPDAAIPTVDAYMAQGWVFAAAHLTRSTNGLNAPHPIRISLQSPETVYPVKLTALNAPSLPLDVFLLCDRPLKHNLLHATFRDEFHAATPRELEREYFRHLDRDKFQPLFPSPAYRGNSSWLVQPDLAGLAWDGCWLTRIEGTLSSRSMRQDLTFRHGPRKPFRRTVFSGQGAWHCVAILGSTLFGLWSLGAAISERNRQTIGRHSHGWWRRSLARLIAVFGLALLVRCALPILPVSWSAPRYFASPYHWLLPMILDSAKEDFLSSPQKTLRASVNRTVDEGEIRFPAKVSEDGGPGDISVVENGCALAIRYQDQNGLPIEIPVPPKQGPPNTSR